MCLILQLSSCLFKANIFIIKYTKYFQSFSNWKNEVVTLEIFLSELRIQVFLSFIWNQIYTMFRKVNYIDF